MSGLIFVLFLLLLLALLSVIGGVMLSLFSVSLFEIRRRAAEGDVIAKLAYPVCSYGNELLVVLFSLNAIVTVMTVLAINSVLGGNWFGTIIVMLLSTLIIVTFGQLIPRIYAAPKGLAFGSRFAPYLLKIVRYGRRVVRPIAKQLDKADAGYQLGFHSSQELIKLLGEHEHSKASTLSESEIDIIRGAITFGDKLVSDVMTPRSVMVTISKDEVVSPRVLKELHDSGHSRFPVYDKATDEVVGTLFLRELLAKKAASCTVGHSMYRKVFFVNEDQTLDHVLHAFLTTQWHMFMVVNRFGDITGLVTIEDVIEEIMGREIVDEFDQYEDLQQVAALQAAKRYGKASAKQLVGPTEPSEPKELDPKPAAKPH